MSATTTETTPLDATNGHDDGMWHAVWADEDIALCGFRFPAASTEDDCLSDADELECVVCAELAARWLA